MSQSPPPPALEISGLVKRFGAVTALDGVGLAVAPAELLVVLGPTGAGKTTLLRAIAGLEAPDAGRVVMAGHDVTAAPPAARDVALVFQNFSLYPEWTVRRNLEFPLRAPGRNLDRERIDERVGWAARLLRIGELLDRPASRLSGGQLQRVAIGRAIVRRPRLFLMDEPLTNLDAKLRESLRVELVQLQRELATPMVYVTHDQAEALSMGDRVAVLARGRVLQVGDPRDVYRQPASALVSCQLGQPRINLLTVRRRDGAWTTAGGLALLPVVGLAAEVMTLGVRPEDLAVRPEAAPGAVPGTVRVVEDFSSHQVLVVDLAGEEVHALVPGEVVFRPGQRVFVSVTADRVRWFDQQEDRRPQPEQQADAEQQDGHGAGAAAGS